MTEAREAMTSDDLERIKRAQEELTKASHKLAEVMYREAQAQTQPGGAQPQYTHTHTHTVRREG